MDCSTETSRDWEDWQDKHVREPLPDFIQDNTRQPIDYDLLITQFGSQKIDEALLERFRRATGGKLHHLLRRGLAFSHRNLEVILERHEKKEPFFIYAGRGPSSKTIHLGHLVNFQMAQWLSDVFDVPLLVMLSDDEKYYRDNEKTGNTAGMQESLAQDNARDIIAAGCNSDRTFLYSNIRSVGPEFDENERRAMRLLSTPLALAYFGLNPSDVSTGTVFIPKLAFSGTLAAGAIASSFPTIFPGDAERTSSIPCLAICALDEDPYFQFARTITRRLHNASPSLLYIKYVSSPEGSGLKMSASAASGVIFMTDNHEQIYEKISHTTNEGSQSMGEFKTGTGDFYPERSICFQYLSFVLEDDEELDRIRRDSEAGIMSAEDVNKICADKIFEICTRFSINRSLIPDLVLECFMLPRDVSRFPKRATAWPSLNALKLVGPLLEGSGPETLERRQSEHITRRIINIQNDLIHQRQETERKGTLQIASGNGEKEVVQGLLDAGADINTEVRPFGTALQSASKYGQQNIVQMLLNAGAKVDIEGQYCSALCEAAKGGHLLIMQMLIDAGAKVYREGWYQNPLHAASHGGHEKAVLMLIEAGAEINTPGGESRNPLLAALHSKHTKVAQILRDAGAEEAGRDPAGYECYNFA